MEHRLHSVSVVRRNRRRLLTEARHGGKSTILGSGSDAGQNRFYAAAASPSPDRTDIAEVS
jgi:hypothetical protein